MRQNLLTTLLAVFAMINLLAQKHYSYNPETGVFAGIDLSQKHAAILIGHLMGAVKEQSANVYATHMAEREFVTTSINLSFKGESAGEPRNALLHGIYSEDFTATLYYSAIGSYTSRE